MWSVECSNFFFFQKEFFTPGQKPLCQGDCLISLLKGCQRWLRFESGFWCWRGQGRQHCQPSVTASAVSRGDTWAPQWNLESYFLWRNRGRGLWRRGVQMRGREEKHRSNGHREVYHISIQPESEKLSQSQLGVFWRKKLTRGKNRINITALNQYIKTLQCTFERLLEKVRSCSDSNSTWLCLQTAQVRGCGNEGLALRFLPQESTGVCRKLVRPQLSHPSFQNQALAQWKQVSVDRAMLCSGKDGPTEAIICHLCRSIP